jgi:hypothetical protein
MGVGPNHVVGAASWHAQAAWGLWLASMLMFLIYAFTTISSAIDMRDDPPTTFSLETTDYNTPVREPMLRLLTCATLAVAVLLRLRDCATPAPHARRSCEVAQY